MLRLPAPFRIIRELMRDPKNPAKRLEALNKLGQILVPNYRFYWPDPDWCQNGEFNNYLASFGEIDGYNTHRRWNLCQVLRLTSDVPGDTAECGVYKGAASYAILRANEMGPLSRHHYIFDSFEGLSGPSNKDGAYWTKGDLVSPEQVANDALKSFPNKTLMKGWIPSRFEEVSSRRFSFVHIDVDLYEPTKQSLEFFYSRLSPGGVLLCDDYGLKVCPGATQACDDFLREKPEKMLSLAVGGGFFSKGTVTSPELYS